MACISCSTKFNFFHKEMGCASCGRSFCSKCLKQKCIIPNKGNTEQNVCKMCYTKFSAGSSNAENPIIPPDIYIRRLENLENPSAPPITIYQKSTKLQKLRSGLAPADLEILERLERLRKDKIKAPPTTDTEIRTRLANLKGENPYVEAPTKMLFPPDTSTDQQKADALLEQFMNERDIELAQNPQEGIEARLASLREQGIRPNEGSYISNLHDSSSSEDEVDRITRKIMDEVAIEEKCTMDVSSISPELLTCIICENKGVFRCLDCDGNIYCAGCSKQMHSTWGETDHKIVPLSRCNF